jgi:hypothetical protein
MSTPEADAAELLAFRDDIKPGDVVVTPDATTRALLLGEIVGHYTYLDASPVGDYHHVRTVRWATSFARDLVPNGLAVELRYRRTLRRLTHQREWAAIVDRARAGALPAPAPPQRAHHAAKRAGRIAAAKSARRCEECQLRLPVSQFEHGSAVCRSCA